MTHHGFGTPLGTVAMLPRYLAAIDEHVGSDMRPTVLSHFIHLPGDPARWGSTLASLDQVRLATPAGGFADVLVNPVDGAGAPKDADVASGIHDQLFLDAMAALTANGADTRAHVIRYAAEMNDPAKGFTPDAIKQGFARLHRLLQRDFPSVGLSFTILPNTVDWTPFLPEKQHYDLGGADLFSLAQFAPLLWPEGGEDPGLPPTAAAAYLAAFLSRLTQDGKALSIPETCPAGIGAQHAGYWYALKLLCWRTELSHVCFLGDDFTGSKWDKWGNCAYWQSPEFMHYFATWLEDVTP